MKNLGFSLVELAVSLGLVGGLGLMIMTQSSSENKTRRISMTATKAADLTLLIQTILENPKACLNTFPLKDAVADSATQIKNYTGSVRYETGKNYEGLTVESIALKLGKNDGTYVVPSSLGFTNVEIVFHPGAQNSATSTEKFMKRFPIWIEANADGKIIKCSSLNLYSSNYWMRSYQNADNIFYQAGSVGAGTTTPAPKLEAGGSLRTESTAGSALTIGGNEADRFRLSVNDGRALEVKHMPNSGDLTVRGMIVTKEIQTSQLGDCSSSDDLGTVRYNETVSKVELCVFGNAGYQWIFFLE